MKILVPYQLTFINERLELDIQPSDIDRTHRIGNKNKARKKGRAVIIKFTRCSSYRNKYICYRKFDFLTNDKVKRCER